MSIQNPCQPEGLKAERVQILFAQLIGWSMIWEWNPQTREKEPVRFWTAFELADHLEACELVAELGVLADTWCSTPDIEVRGNLVFVTCGSELHGLKVEDFDFAKAVDREIGNGQRRPIPNYNR